MKGLEGKTALVTGGSSGIGQAIAIGLGRAGVDVAINYVGRPEGAEATREAIEGGVDRCVREVQDAGAKALLVEADVSNEGDVERMFKDVAAELGTVDFLVNNAGIQLEITPAAVAQASSLVRTGSVYDLSHLLDEHVPAFPGRTFRQHLTTSAHQLNRRAPGAGPEGLGRNNVNWIVEYVAAPSQMGTHMDGLNHLQIGDRAYNGPPPGRPRGGARHQPARH